MFKKYTKILGIVFAVGISLAIFIFRDQLIHLKNYGYVGLFFLNLFGSATIFMPTPLFLTAFAAGAVFNPFTVAVVSSLGSAIGEITGYMIGLGGGSFAKDGAKAKKIYGWMEKYGGWALLVMAMVPNPFFDIAGLIAGATKVPVTKYLFFVWIGKLIKFMAISYLGAGSFYVLGKGV